MKLNRNITIVKTVKFTSKTPQVNQLVGILQSHKKDTITEQELAELLEKRKNQATGGLTTRQNGFLIFQYYRPELLTNGVIKMDVSSRGKVVKTPEQCAAELAQLQGK